MRFWTRLLLLAAAAGLPLGLAMASCSTGAVGVSACQTIEEARCTLAPACTPGFDVDRCQRYYRDDCQNGLQNAEAGADGANLDTAATGCVTAMKAVAACVGASSAACTAAIPDASCYEVDAAATACNVILNCPEVLPACAFVGSEVPAPDAGTGGAGTGGAGTGGTGTGGA